MSRFNHLGSLATDDGTIERVKRLEVRLEDLASRLERNYLRGRLRTDITSAPSSSTDINTTDQIWDIVILDDAQYIVVNNAGSLEWRKITLGVF